MNIEVKFNNTVTADYESLIIPMTEELEFNEIISEIDQKLNGIISRAIKCGNFNGKKDEVFQIFADNDNLPNIIILIGYGKIAKIDHNKIMYLGGKIISYLNNLRVKSSYIISPEHDLEYDDSSSLIAYGGILRNYKFNKYRTKDLSEHQSYVKSVTIYSSDVERSQKFYNILISTAEGIYLTRDLVSEPPNFLNPESFAEEVYKLSEYGIEIEILDQSKMLDLGMGALLGVGQGSKKESKLAIMRYKNNPKTEDYQLALIGKGVTFDTGGISIKPAVGMESMKYDMAGAGVVVGLMKSVALRKSKVNIVGLIGIVENMPDGNAQRPSDVVKSMSGQTIEVLNTDAEGRLVLADVLWYCQDKYKPNYMIDLATLTGAITITFGSYYGGLFSNDDELADKIFDSGVKADEKVWRLPMGEYYDKMLNSEIADMQNISTEKGAGSIIAAQFLERFIGNTKWAHLDIAGMSWTKKESGVTPKGATAFGLRLLDRFIKDNIE